MNLISSSLSIFSGIRNGTADQAKVQNRIEYSDEVWINPFGGDGSQIRRSTAGWLGAIKDSPALSAVIRRISKDVATKADWHLYKKKLTGQGKPKKIRLQNDDSHKAVRFMQNCWKHCGGGTFLQLVGLIQGWKDSTGNAFLLIDRDPITNEPIGLIPIPVHLVTVERIRVRGSKREVHLWFNVSIPGTDQFEKIPEDDMIWIRDPSWSDTGGIGVGIATCLNDELSQDENAAKFNNAFFRNGATPHIMVGIDDKGMVPAELELFKQKWLNAYAGVSNAFKALFVNRDISVTPFSAKHRDMQFLDLRKFYRDTVFMVFQMPPAIMGVIEDSNRASAQAAIVTYSELVLLSRMIEVCEDLNRQFFHRFWPDVWLGFTSPVKETAEFELKKTEFAWLNGLIDCDTACEQLGYDPPGGVIGGRRMIAANMLIINPDGTIIAPSQPTSDQKTDSKTTDKPANKTGSPPKPKPATTANGRQFILQPVDSPENGSEDARTRLEAWANDPVPLCDWILN